MNNYGYTYRGGPLLRWGHGTPVQTKAADAQSLGSLEGSTLAGSTLLPAPGAPEPIGVTGSSMMPAGGSMPLGGCSCSGTCGCTGTATATGDISDSVPGGWITIGVAALLAWHFMRKRRA